jgi:hypothetical protein
MGWKGLTGAAKGQWRSVLGFSQGARSRGCVAACYHSATDCGYLWILWF